MLEYTVEKHPNDRAVFYLSGRLDANTASKLKDALRDAAANYAVHLIIDMANLDFIDSSGLGALVSAFKAARERQGSLALVSAGPQVKVALELTRLNQIFPVFDDVRSAINMG